MGKEGGRKRNERRWLEGWLNRQDGPLLHMLRLEQ